MAPKWLASRRRFVTKAVTTHNLAIAHVDGEYLFVGGRYRLVPPYPSGARGRLWSRSAASGCRGAHRWATRRTRSFCLGRGCASIRICTMALGWSACPMRQEPLRLLPMRAFLRRDCASSESTPAAWSGEAPHRCSGRACHPGRASLTAGSRSRAFAAATGSLPANLATSGQRFVQAASSTDLERGRPFSSSRSRATRLSTATSTTLRCSRIRPILRRA